MRNWTHTRLGHAAAWLLLGLLWVWAHLMIALFSLTGWVYPKDEIENEL